jgi:hypothetical protein
VSPRPRVLVVGGAGAFGSRLCAGLAATLDCEIVLAGRDRDRAERACARLRRLHPDATLSALALDGSRATAGALAELGVAVAVDAAGPYRPGAYGFAQACIGAGVPYIDLADGRAFVAGFSAALDAAARRAGVPALCGASSTPALSNAALDALARDWRAVTAVEVAISPGNRAPRGLSVFASILAYVGRPVRIRRDGAWSEAPGWGLTVTRPMVELGRRRLSLCETPDLDILPARRPELRTALFRAGLELRILHDGLRLAALPVRAGLLPSLVPLARAFRWAATGFERLGSDRGGMEVVAEGIDAAGRPVRATWFLVAEAGDGPFVPTLPALALVRRILAGAPPAPGARPCVGELTLDAIEAEMRRLRIRTGIVPGPPALPP